MSKATEAIITASEILNELYYINCIADEFSDTSEYDILMENLDLSDDHFREVRQELSRLAEKKWKEGKNNESAN